MSRNALLLVVTIAILVVGASILLQSNTPTASVSTSDGTRIEAPGTKVESNDDQTRIQAPGVDITVPKKNDGD